MKLIYCNECIQIISLAVERNQNGSIKEIVTYCRCEKCAGKWLSNGVHAVFTKNCIMVGIDNNTWDTAIRRYDHYKNLYKTRCDFFFTGWIPTIPSEIFVVDTIKEVKEYPFICEQEKISTMPVSQ